MDWEAIQKRADELVKAHPGYKPWQLAQMLQGQFQDQPMTGWFILQALENRSGQPRSMEPEE